MVPLFDFRYGGLAERPVVGRDATEPVARRWDKDVGGVRLEPAISLDVLVLIR